MNQLYKPLVDFGRLWAESPERPRPKPQTLQRWDELLDQWIEDSNLPLIYRSSGKRDRRAICQNGREVVFSDNSPANWSLSLSLEDEIPDIRSWNVEKIENYVPLTFLSKIPNARRDLNKFGWKVCHIDSVSDRKRISVENSPTDRIEDAFRRLISPRNMFLVPKEISGAGELPQVIDAIRAYNRSVDIETLSD